jgi:hypothetical protein
MPAPDYAIEIAAIESAISKNELEVVQNGERVTYNSISEMMKALSYFRNRSAENATSGGSTTLAAYVG